MKRFTTTTGETLGTTFCGDLKLSQDLSGLTKRTLCLTKEEEKLLWSLSEDTLCLEDECLEWRLGDLLDFFRTECGRCSKEEFLKRGWKESRWSEGLSFQKGLDKDGKEFLLR